MPMLPDFSIVHQWVRELRRDHDERMIAVHFRLPAATVAYVGRYNAPHSRVELREAVPWVREHPMGAEIVVEGPIRRAAIVAIREIPQLVGWTEAPDRTKLPDCVCRACVPSGLPDTYRRVRAYFNRFVDDARRATSAEDAADALRRLDVAAERAGRRLPMERLVPLSRHESAIVRSSCSWLLGYAPSTLAVPVLTSLVRDPDERVVRSAAESITRIVGPRRTLTLIHDAPACARVELANAIVCSRDEAGSVAVLTALLSDADADVRHAARVSLDLFAEP